MARSEWEGVGAHTETMSTAGSDSTSSKSVTNRAEGACGKVLPGLGVQMNPIRSPRPSSDQAAAWVRPMLPPPTMAMACISGPLC